MEDSMSRIVIGTVLKRTLKNIKDSPERGIRNLVDMALQFSQGRSQQSFFTAAQKMLQNENSAYYDLARDVVFHTDMERLYTFGMNAGYNGCTAGARRLRENEARLNCRIPWALTARLDTERFAENRQRYHGMIEEGERLGIYIWMLFAMPEPRQALTLAREHPDSAFCIFCQAEELSAAVLDEAAELRNVMLVVRYEESAADLFATLREMGLLYSAWYPYGQKDAQAVLNGEVFSAAQQFAPVFTILVPDKDCPEEVRRLVHQAVVQAREAQTYRTILWELQGDNRLVDSAISGDACPVYFNGDGDLCEQGGKIDCEHNNLCRSGLADILVSACPREAAV